MTSNLSQERRREISRGTVVIYKTYLGRGPTSARAHLDGDVVTVICEDGMTMAERKLVEAGSGDQVRDIRRRFQHVMAADLRALVETTLGRKCRSVLSDHDVESDIAVEVMLLEPVEE